MTEKCIQFLLEERTSSWSLKVFVVLSTKSDLIGSYEVQVYIYYY